MFSANYLPPTGSTEPATGPSVRLSPNPVRDVCTVFIPDRLGEAVTMQLYDLRGRVVKSVQWTGASEQIDLSGLPAGTYIYDLRGKDWRKSGKVVKV
jgi:hypothetical protein